MLNMLVEAAYHEEILMKNILAALVVAAGLSGTLCAQGAIEQLKEASGALDSARLETAIPAAKDASEAEPIKSILREFENNNASGEVWAMTIGGTQKVTPAKACIAEWESYLFGNDPKRAGHYLQLTVDNTHGMSFVNIHLPWQKVPPFSLMPTDFSARDSEDASAVVTIKGNLLTFVETKTFGGLDSSWDEIETATLRFNPDFTKIWDMTLSTRTDKEVDGAKEKAPRMNVTATCSGEFKMTKNEVDKAD